MKTKYFLTLKTWFCYYKVAVTSAGFVYETEIFDNIANALICAKSFAKKYKLN